MTISILIDMNLSPDWTAVLTSAGFNAVHWAKVGDPKASDRELMDWAIAHHHIILTHDLDFGTILALTHAVGPSVIQIRSRQILPQQLAPTLIPLLQKYQTELSQRALIVVDELHNRVRILPL